MGRSRLLTAEQDRQQREMREFLDLAEIFRALAKKYECGDPRTWVPLFEAYLKTWPGAGKPWRLSGRRRPGSSEAPGNEGRGSGWEGLRVGDIAPGVTGETVPLTPLSAIFEDLTDPLDGLELSPEDLRKLDGGRKEPGAEHGEPDPDPGE